MNSNSFIYSINNQQMKTFFYIFEHSNSFVSVFVKTQSFGNFFTVAHNCWSTYLKNSAVCLKFQKHNIKINDQNW